MNKTLVLTVCTLVVLGGAGVLWYLSMSQDRTPNRSTCTMEALLCPDGSTVGRSGEACTFAPCPYSGPYEGTLLAQGDGFVLSIEAPEGPVQNEVTYALPLAVSVTNGIRDLLGTQVRAYGVFREGGTLLVETLEPVVPNGETGVTAQATAGVGETVFAGGVRITLHEVVADYRCPADVQCIQGGAITARVTFTSDTDTETFNMPSDEAPRPFDAFEVSIVGVQPDLISTEIIDADAYRATFEVAPLAENR